jgi:hypothetical protein
MQGSLEEQPFTAVQRINAALQAVKRAATICFSFAAGRGLHALDSANATLQVSR